MMCLVFNNFTIVRGLQEHPWREEVLPVQLHRAQGALLQQPNSASINGSR